MSDDSMLDAEAQVDRVLALTGLPVSPEERARLIKLYPFIRQSQDALRLPETRYAEPAVIYPATFER